MKAEKPIYDHRLHTGNAGDVWKHLLLAEVADHLLAERKTILYAESHVGYPEYSLPVRGEWEGGIGRCWPHISALKNFCYFRIVGDMNPQGLVSYPGSASLVLEAAKRHGADIDAEIWDIDLRVAAAWHGDPGVNFHLGDGFAGVRSLLDLSPPGLLLIDPPYLDEKDAVQAVDLLRAARKADWIVLWWQMMGAKTLHQGSLRSYPLRFSDAGLDGGRWQGAVVAVAGADESLAEHLGGRFRRFLKIMRSEQRF